MKKTIEKFNEYLKPYYSLLTMLGFFFVLFISAYKFIISPSDLRITVQDESVSYPSSLGEYCNNLNKYLLKQDTLQTEALTLYGFLLKTTDFKKIILKNTTSKTLRGIKFKQLNTDALTAYSVSSDFFTKKEETELRSNLIFDEMRHVIYFKSEVELPPSSQINISLWGNFKPELINNDLIISYDGGDGHIEKSYTITGLKGYFVNYSFEFLVIVILIFIAVYYVGIKNIKQNDI